MIRHVLKFGLLASALCGGGLLALAIHRPTVDGSGVSLTEERDLSDASEVTFSGDGALTIVRGDPASVTVTSDDNIVPLLKTEVSGRTLSLSSATAYSVRPTLKPEYRVTLPNLSSLTVSGAGTATVEKPIGGELKVKLSGAGTVNLRDVTYQSLNVTTSGAGKVAATGAATRAQFKLSGAGTLDAVGLRTSYADVQVSGAGQAQVWAALDLKARVSGAGGVRYKGTPNVSQQVSGAGRVRPLE